ncbi:MAG: hypothetical protein KAQ65_03120 [Candidatus Thorarchaeota archaeon]|nr:hypothetical protein [Candidatus Thorarchaeota archaeon]MCK5237937.1 hypothetical protein [Candidatus Thorarchaeota archaeon]
MIEGLSEIDAEIGKLDEQARSGEIEMGVFAHKRVDLADRRRIFEEELHRLGM